MSGRKSLLVYFGAVLALAACDGGSTGGTGATGGGGGAIGGSTAGGGGSGGATGGSTTGGGGSGGAMGGSGGATGGSGGSGGTPQCEDGASCQLVNDCCSCVAIGPGETAPDCNIPECLVPACESVGNPGQGAQCVVGQCVAALDCDHSKVACAALPPQCPPGQTPTVKGLCWGGCGEAVECATVAGCDQCTGGLACVVEETQIGPQYHCVAPPAGCAGGVPTCACMGGAVCVPPFDQCMESGGALICSCTNC